MSAVTADLGLVLNFYLWWLGLDSGADGPCHGLISPSHTFYDLIEAATFPIIFFRLSGICIFGSRTRRMVFIYLETHTPPAACEASIPSGTVGAPLRCRVSRVFSVGFTPTYGAPPNDHAMYGTDQHHWRIYRTFTSSTFLPLVSSVYPSCTYNVPPVAYTGKPPF